MRTVMLLRHGESEFNRQNRFTGWQDVELSENGVVEAHRAGRILRDEGFRFDKAWTSVLKRAIITLHVVLEEMDLLWIPVVKTWRLNERHYGELEGYNKETMARMHGEELVHEWRRSFDKAPPPVPPDDNRWPGHLHRYAEIPRYRLPVGESLKDAIARMMPVWHDEIAPSILHGGHVLIVAHGNTLRALIKHLMNIPEDEVSGLNVPTGVPQVFKLADDLSVLDHWYLEERE